VILSPKFPAQYFRGARGAGPHPRRAGPLQRAAAKGRRAARRGLHATSLSSIHHRKIAARATSSARLGPVIKTRPSRSLSRILNFFSNNTPFSVTASACGADNKASVSHRALLQSTSPVKRHDLKLSKESERKKK